MTQFKHTRKKKSAIKSYKRQSASHGKLAVGVTPSRLLPAALASGVVWPRRRTRKEKFAMKSRKSRTRGKAVTSPGGAAGGGGGGPFTSQLYRQLSKFYIHS